MICPKCRAEYREGFYRCSECDIPLVDSLPEEPTAGTLGHSVAENRDLVEVARTLDGSLLLVFKSLLDSAGIPYTVHGERSIAMEPVGGAFGRPLSSWGATILVSQDRAEEARAVLEIDD